MTRIVTMTRDQLDRRIHRAVQAALRPTTSRAPSAFRATRDPATGRMDMVPVDRRTWGEPGTSPAVVAAVGPLLYDRCTEDHDGDEDGRSFAVVGLVRSAEFLAGHADEEELGRFARDYVAIARGHADGSVLEDCCLVLDFATSDTGRRMSFGAQMTCESVVFSIFDRTTATPYAPPVAFFYDEGDLGREEAGHCLPLDVMRLEDEATRALVARMRREAAPAQVLDMDAFRARRAG